MLAGVAALPVLWHYRAYFNKWRTLLPAVVGAELIGTVTSLALLYLGLAQVDAIHASLITTTTPLFVVIAGVFLLREKLELHETIGASLAFAGTLLLTLAPVWTHFALSGTVSEVGIALLVGQNTATALYFILAKRLYKNIPKLLVASISFWVGALCFGIFSLAELAWSPAALLSIAQTELATPSVQLAAIYMGIFGSLIGLTAYIKGQDGIEASEASLFFYLQPAVYIPLGYVLLGEIITPVQIGALVVVLLGIFVAERRT
jgi:drug/metabolite transporter (DMT)-like permease